MATVRNLFVDRGAAFSTTIVVSDSTDTPIDLTAYTYRAQLRKSHHSLTATDFTVTCPTPTSGTLIIELTSEQCITLKSGRYVYDVIIIDSAGQGTRVLEGIIVVNPDVTKIPVPTTTTTTV